jgi:hypothetical protein
MSRDKSICKDCGSTPEPGKRRCNECRAKHNEREAQRRSDRRARERCTVCGLDVEEDRNMCAVHLEYYQHRQEVTRLAQTLTPRRVGTSRKEV